MAPRRGSGGAGTGSTGGYTGRFALIIPHSPLPRKSLRSRLAAPRRSQPSA
jgi:hypothetical protein